MCGQLFVRKRRQLRQQLRSDDFRNRIYIVHERLRDELSGRCRRLQQLLLVCHSVRIGLQQRQQQQQRKWEREREREREWRLLRVRPLVEQRLLRDMHEHELLRAGGVLRKRLDVRGGVHLPFGLRHEHHLSGQLCELTT